MARYVATLESKLPPADAFAYMSDFTNTRHWDPGVQDATSDGSGAALGRVFRLRYRMLGRTTELVYRVVDYQPRRWITLECQTALMSIRDHIDVAVHPTGSLITYDATVTLKGVLRLADPALAIGFRRNADEALAGLRRAIGL